MNPDDPACHVARVGSAAGRQFAAAALSELALENESTRDAIVGAYGLAPLISLLRQVRFLNGDLLWLPLVTSDYASLTGISSDCL